MHALIKIIFLIAFLLIINTLNAELVLVLCMTVSVFAMLVENSHFLPILKRMRWLWLSLLLIYALSTPGEYMMNFPGPFKPTFEGFKAGVMQAARLCAAVACLHLLVSTSKKEELLAALYYLLLPLKLFGLKVEQFAARLYLTLEYAEEIATQPKVNVHFLQLLHHPMDIKNEKPVEIQQLQLKWNDKLAMFILITAVLLMLFFQFTQ